VPGGDSFIPLACGGVELLPLLLFIVENVTDVVVDYGKQERSETV
jgi:hypothetical protein